MIQYFEGTVFNAKADALVNAVNCVGAMGAGIALEFKLRFPKMYLEYKEWVEKDLLVPGKLHYYQDDQNLTIINFPTKDHWRHPSKLEYIELGLKEFAASCKNYNISSIAFPTLGTGRGGLKWNQVKPLMEHYLQDLNLDVIICLDYKPEAEGTEREMLQYLNSADLTELRRNVRLTATQLQSLEAARPYQRFRLISSIKGLGPKTYAALFRHIYKQVQQREENTQLKLEF